MSESRDIWHAQHSFGEELLKALGLEGQHVKELNLNINAPEGTVEVEAVMYVELPPQEKQDALIEVVKRYKLVPREGGE